MIHFRAPTTTTTNSWPPNYTDVFAWRQQQLIRLRRDPKMMFAARAFYARHPVEFINHWCDTYDPRNAGQGKLTRMPLVLFERQADLIRFLVAALEGEENGLIEKARDMGATWVCAAFSVWLWLFKEGAAIGWGSRKQEYVDKLGDSKSIFEKIRLLIKFFPREFWPQGFEPSQHMPFMRVINPENGASIVGEAGDNMGRGGRTLVYFKDEAQPLDEPVLTPTGWRTMGDLSAGDFVIGSSGEPTRVLGVSDKGTFDCYRLTFSDGSSTIASEGHRWVFDLRGRRVERRTADLVRDHVYRSPGGQVQYPFCLPEFAGASGRNANLPLDPYLVGAFLGDGSMGRSSSFGLTVADPEIAERVATAVPAGSRLEKRDRLWYALVSADGRQGRRKSPAREAFEAAGLWGQTCQNKRVPVAYMTAPRADRIDLLRGLMDTDGSCYGGSNVFVNSSLGLCEDVAQIARSLGGKASIKKSGTCWKVYIATPVCPYHLARKAERWNPKQSVQRSLRKVEPIGAKPVRCITVEAKDGIYITRDFIPTHNSAHYQRPEMIEAALADNTRVQIDISSVNGLGNVFHRRREAGVEWNGGPAIKGRTNLFIMDWADHPAKDQAWFDTRKAKAIADGLGHVFAQEIERNYAAALEGAIIKPEWVKAAIDAHKVLGFAPEGGRVAGLDVADSGLDRNAWAERKGVVLTAVDEWSERDVGTTARRAAANAEGAGEIEIQYDCIGVGAGVKSEANRLVDDSIMPSGVSFVPWNAAARVQDPDEPVIEDDDESPLNKDFFQNLKAQGWWALSRRFFKTWQAVHEGIEHPADELISLDGGLPKLRTVEKELCQPTMGKSASTMKMMVNKTPEGTASPNIADAIMMAYWPVIEHAPQAQMFLRKRRRA